ncbi:NTP transferase domain-containing protein [Leifsonia sp. H3M29-4]|uniref:nucleotidyltransferase family protein n=1 Tax=Salinibacterium metalliresistens TaxID=3031321 RepID=UPI0023DB197F|nr:NTP transferase domain-containing protein [Salinibacterium metalliresistens]MDF1479272.1 NTP transferase domain-containing protein [Salinibacterium metalliresistens]
MDATGIVLAAGAGTRAGGPKALLRLPDGTSWIAASTAALLGGGCSRVVVVLGAMAQLARPLVPGAAEVVVADDWSAGMSASLRAGLAAASGDAALVTLVDLPSLPVSVVRRVLAAGTLAQAVYDGRPGHPVLIPAAHWAGAAESSHGDRGARDYLVAQGALEIECGDLWHGIDRDEG